MRVFASRQPSQLSSGLDKFCLMLQRLLQARGVIVQVDQLRAALPALQEISSVRGGLLGVFFRAATDSTRLANGCSSPKLGLRCSLSESEGRQT
jgi:hypothetical protein